MEVGLNIMDLMREKNYSIQPNALSLLLFFSSSSGVWTISSSSLRSSVRTNSMYSSTVLNSLPFPYLPLDLTSFLESLNSTVSDNLGSSGQHRWLTDCCI